MNSFGRILRLNIFGESHGKNVGIVVDGIPAGIPISVDDFIYDIERRKPGKKGTTNRIEDDTPDIISGLFNGYTTGTPLCMLFKNKNVQSEDYHNIQEHFRPGHSDFTAYTKYNGFNDPRGGGHFSGRLTLPLVAAGVIAKKIVYPVIINAKLIEAGGSVDVEQAVKKAIEQKDSIGGIVECSVDSLPVGIGEPFFDSLESVLSHAVFAIPAVKAIEFGSGFQIAKMKGSEANDIFTDEKGQTQTNHNGGINGGISNGNQMLFRIAIKPASSIGQTQTTFNFENIRMEDLTIHGRHDSCIAIRVPVVLEAVTAIVLADFILLAKSSGLNNHP